MNKVNVFTYWETSPFRTTIPPYILCGLISMQMALGDRFTLISPSNLSDEVDFDFASKEFLFAGIADREKDSISRITAKSDFIRFKRIYDRGGVWLDADTIVISNFLYEIDPLLISGKLVWHSEQFFGALPGCPLIGQAVANMLSAQRQTYANPGNIKEAVQSPENKDGIVYVPQKIWDPTGTAAYKSVDWKMGYEHELSVGEFIKNRDCKIIKMYNSMLATYDYSKMTVREFLESGVLFSRIFLNINPNVQFWAEGADALNEALAPQ